MINSIECHSTKIKKILQLIKVLRTLISVSWIEYRGRLQKLNSEK